MSEPLLLVEREGAIAVVTLNRPEALNALSRALRIEISRTFRALAADETVRAVVLTGAGRAFTAGIDLKEAGAQGFDIGMDGTEVDFSPVLAAYPWPIIVAVNGFAITGGFELVLMGDVIYASSAARFADTHGRVGVMPGWGLSQKLSRLIGLNRAKELSLSGNFLDAETAERWGLVNRVFAPDDLLPAARKLAHEMASLPPAMLRKYKRLIDDGFGLPFGEAMALEAKTALDHAASITRDGIEAARKQVQERGRSQTI
jgi:enoyl-CoA hydratase